MKWTIRHHWMTVAIAFAALVLPSLGALMLREPSASAGALAGGGGGNSGTLNVTGSGTNYVNMARPANTYECADGTAIGGSAAYGCWKWDSVNTRFQFNDGILVANTSQVLATTWGTITSGANGGGLQALDLNGDGSGVQAALTFGTSGQSLANAASSIAKAINNDAVQWRMGPNGLQTLYGTAPRRVGCYQTVTSADTDLSTVGTQVIGLPAGTAANGGGTCTPAALTTDNNYDMVKFPTDGALANHACGKAGPFTVARATHSPLLYGVVRTDASSIANQRIWFALTSAALNQVSTLAGSNAIKYCGFRYDTGLSDTGWQACSSDGTTASCTSTGVSLTTAGTYVLLIDNTISGTCDFYVNGVKTVSKTTNIDTTNTTKGIEAVITELSTNAVALGVSKVILTQN